MTRTAFQQKYRFRWKWQKILGSDCIICNEFMSSRKPWRARSGFCWLLREILPIEELSAIPRPLSSKQAACWWKEEGQSSLLRGKEGKANLLGPNRAREPGKASAGYGRTDCLIVATCGDFEDQVAIKQIGLGGNPFSFINCTLNCSASNIRGLFGLPQLSLSYVLVVSIDHITQTQKKRREKCGW